MHSVPVVVEQAFAAAADLLVAAIVVAAAAAVDDQQVRCNTKNQAVVAKRLSSSLIGRQIEKLC
jgi:hypothetical protein